MHIDKRINKDNWDEIKDILPQITDIKSLDLSERGLTEFPKMSHITIIEWFNCSYNQITSFKNCPQISGVFYCHDNQITSFKDCPQIGSYFFCHNNKISSFKDCPIIKGSFHCSNNQITSFKSCPKISGDFWCHGNNITSFKDFPDIGGGLFSNFRLFDTVHKYSKENKISLLEAQVELYNQQDKQLLAHIDKFPDLVAYIRLKECSKLLD